MLDMTCTRSGNFKLLGPEPIFVEAQLPAYFSKRCLACFSIRIPVLWLVLAGDGGGGVGEEADQLYSSVSVGFSVDRKAWSSRRARVASGRPCPLLDNGVWM